MQSQSKTIGQRRCHRRLRHLPPLIFVIAAGLILRLFGYEAHLPYFLVKYGGSVLWGAMVYLLLALFVEKRPTEIALMAISVATAVELFRLYHTPWLDEFRLTLAGALLLGRIFSFGNILAYWIGIAAVWIVVNRRQG